MPLPVRLNRCPVQVRAKCRWVRAKCQVECRWIGCEGAGCRVQGGGCRVHGAWCRVQGTGCRVHVRQPLRAQHAYAFTSGGSVRYITSASHLNHMRRCSVRCITSWAPCTCIMYLIWQVLCPLHHELASAVTPRIGPVSGGTVVHVDLNAAAGCVKCDGWRVTCDV